MSTGPGNYSFWDGTSMATPHVSAAAALAWSQKPDCTNQQIRDALKSTASNNGSRNNATGYGLVNAAQAAITVAGLDCSSSQAPTPPPENPAGPSCTPSGESCTTSSECCSLTCKGKPGIRICK